MPQPTDSPLPLELPRSRRWERWLYGSVLGSPFLGLVALLASLATSQSTELRWARVSGGPCDAGQSPFFQLRMMTDERPSRQQGQLLLQLAHGARVSVPFQTGDDGEAQLTLASPLHDRVSSLEVRGSQGLWASGALPESARSWWQQRRSLGGWLKGRVSGEPVLRVGIESGLLAAQMPGMLLVSGVPPGQRLVALSDDLGFQAAQHEPAAIEQTATRVSFGPIRGGVVRLAVFPIDIGSSLELQLLDGDVLRSTWSAGVPTVRQSTMARKTGQLAELSLVGGLREVQLAWLSEQGWLQRETLRFQPSSAPATRSLGWPARLTAPAWLLVTEAGELSSALAWPLTSPGEVRPVLQLVSPLLLDGKSSALKGGDARRRLNRQRVSALVAASALVGALAMLGLFGLAAARQRRESELGSRQERSLAGGAGLMMIWVLSYAALLAWVRLGLGG